MRGVVFWDQYAMNQGTTLPYPKVRLGEKQG